MKKIMITTVTIGSLLFTSSVAIAALKTDNTANESVPTNSKVLVSSDESKVSAAKSQIKLSENMKNNLVQKYTTLTDIRVAKGQITKDEGDKLVSAFREKINSTGDTIDLKVLEDLGFTLVFEKQKNISGSEKVVKDAKLICGVMVAK